MFKVKKEKVPLSKWYSQGTLIDWTNTNLKIEAVFYSIIVFKVTAKLFPPL
jgi:hypothetical protein